MTHFNPPSTMPTPIDLLEICSRVAIVTSRLHVGYKTIVIAVEDGQFYEWSLSLDETNPSTAAELNARCDAWAAALGGLLVMSSIAKDEGDG